MLRPGEEADFKIDDSCTEKIDNSNFDILKLQVQSASFFQKEIINF